MSSKREEERNEKIIRGLMKLPPNRRCINCNSMGPQYVCTNFWTFVCVTCSGIHREFTHRVKSVSMAKFTSQEVDALQKGGNQRAKELFLKAWDSQRQRLPDNSNIDKVREFIRSVYVQKKYALEKSSDRPPRDPQSLRSHDDETRRASSYHSYSQSPPYDFQYEERLYGKNAPALTRKPGSDRGLYDGKLSSFFSPGRLSNHSNGDKFANEGSNPRVSDYSISSGGDPFRSEVLSPRSQRDAVILHSETSGDMLSENNSDAISRNAGERKLPPQRTSSLGSFGSSDSNSMSFKSVNSAGLSEVAFESEQSIELTLDKTVSFPHTSQSMKSGNFNSVDLFSSPFAPENVTSVTAPAVSNSQMPESSLPQFIDLFQQYPTSVPTLNGQKPLQTLQPSSLDLFASVPQTVVSLNEKTSNVVLPSNEGWATFDSPQNLMAKGTGNSVPRILPLSDETVVGNNPFLLVQSLSQDFARNKPSVSGPSFWHDGLQMVEGITNNTQLWDAFEDSSSQLLVQDVTKSGEGTGNFALDVDKSIGFAVNEAVNGDGILRISDGSECPYSSLPPSFKMALPDASTAPTMAGRHPLATDHKPTNPFDSPYESEMESGCMDQFWEMSPLQDALPNEQLPISYVGGVNQSWFPRNSVASYIPGGVAFDPPSGSLEFIPLQTPGTQFTNAPSEGSIASIRGNPFA